jgi:outer membrane protein assembly factor BamB
MRTIPWLPMNLRPAVARLLAACALGVAIGALAEDWPTLGHDNRRSHVTGDRVTVPLRLAWTRACPPPQTAWPGPAKWDAYAALKDLASMRNFDPTYFVIAVGDRVWYGSAVDDSVHCLDAASGREEWVFTADGPVRLPPAWAAERLYAGADDGTIYCLGAAQGDLLWTYKAVEKDRFLPSDGKLISTWPVRTGILLSEGLAYFGASLLPWNPSYLCAVDAGSGKPVYRVEHAGLTMQGALVASTDRLFISQGRQAPIACELRTGRLLGSIGKSGNGGVWGILIDSDVFVHGRGQNHGSGGELRGVDSATAEVFATFPQARFLAATGDTVYLLGEGTLKAWDRTRFLDLQRESSAGQKAKATAEKKLKDLGDNGDPAARAALRAEIEGLAKREAEIALALPGCVRWQVDTPCQHSLILTADLVFAGGPGMVAAFSPADGKKAWEGPVGGNAYGLAAAGGRLLVSTDSGQICCFAAE